MSLKVIYGKIMLYVDEKGDYMILGDCQKNRWCCFCKNWYDPANKAIKPRVNKNLFDVDKNAKNKCMVKNLMTPALGNCPKFEKKM